ncbi:MAG TPA: glycosyltransferase family 1 protein [Rhizomicrobium sp.]
MHPAVAVDLARLFVAPVTPTPRGIDRVDMAYARHFLQTWPGECVATLPTPWGARCFSRKKALNIVAEASRSWGEQTEPQDDAQFDRLKTHLLQGAGEVSVLRQSPYGVSWHIARGVLRVTATALRSFGQSAVRAIPKHAIYLNTGQIGLASARLTSWLQHRPDIAPVFMLHDTIPLDHAEFVEPYARRLHQNMIANAARHAAGVIVTTEAAGASVHAELRRLGADNIPVMAAPLPVPDAFLQPDRPEPLLERQCYFVVCGTIEPRKNHMLLLNVWKELVREQGAMAPKLVIVGTRWRASKDVVAAIERCELLRGHVLEVGGLSTQALRRLLLSAKALLMPSLAEGFGLPIVEALAVGTPVIASDLAAHREAGGRFASYLQPIDGLGWLAAIRDHMVDSAALREKIRPHRPFTAAAYWSRIEPFLQAAAARTTEQRASRLELLEPVTTEIEFS